MNIVKLIVIALFTAGFVSAKGQTVIMHHHNKIDDIKTSREVVQLINLFLQKNEDYRFDIESTYLNKAVSFKYKVDKKPAVTPLPWVKADFDSNGYTDLLVNVENRYWSKKGQNIILCIMDSGENRLYAKFLTNHRSDAALASLTSISEKPAIVYYHYSPNLIYTSGSHTLPYRLITDTLVYKFGDFIEYTSKAKNYEIAEIRYSYGPGIFGYFPGFTITLKMDGSLYYDGAVLNPDISNPTARVELSATIDNNHSEQLLDFLQYIDFEREQDNYRVRATDQPESFIEVTYNSGKTKNIEDYGGQGTFALKRLYKIFSDLRYNQNWH